MAADYALQLKDEETNKIIKQVEQLDPHNASVLRRNVSWLGERVRVLEGAVSDEAGEALFDSSEYSWGGKLLQRRCGVGLDLLL